MSDTGDEEAKNNSTPHGDCHTVFRLTIDNTPMEMVITAEINNA